MPVFVSYFRADEPQATLVNQYLTAKGVQTYFDKLDASIGHAENVTKAILKGLQGSTHLLAIVSNQTKESWWVPFEIGVATEAERRIATYALSLVALPDFLKVWPLLSSTFGLDRFVERYRQDSFALKSIGRINEARTASIQSARDFHAALKRDLGQV